jgi:mono/diheme cytochrome c family protein
MRRVIGLPAVLIFVWIWISGQSCKPSPKEKTGRGSSAIRKNLSSPVLSPEESIKKMHIENGFEVKLVAAEPLITAPVALNFDEKGRIWVLDMDDYMPDTAGTGEDKPTGKIVILSDSNGDGVMDSRKVFLDSLVLPRALCLIENGILVAEPPKLWYYEIRNDRPVNKTLVDADYAAGGNVEHQPNGLLRALDNWIYNAKSAKRYRKKGNRWLIEKTAFRGQWGISQDDQGHLYYNNNSENLLGDYFSPGLGSANPDQRSVKGYSEKIVPDNRVYPARPTPGVNRGYMEGVLDDSLRLINFTAACGPVIYTGNLFGKDYYENAFVAEPSANLIKRDILKTEGYITTGKEAYAGKEFLASEDERFRPVNLYTGPEGALYIVDMYRGIIQHKTYLTPYLKNEIKERNLTQPLSCGRIYKIVPQNSMPKPVRLSNDPAGLLTALHDANGWVRNKAQQLLTDERLVSTVPVLRNNLKRTDSAMLVIHSLWTLEGLGKLETADVMPLLEQNNQAIRIQALSVIPSVINKKNAGAFLKVFKQLIEKHDELAAPYIGFLLPFVQPLDPVGGRQILKSLTEAYGSNEYVAAAIISNLQHREADYYKESLAINPDTGIAINQQLRKIILDIEKAKHNSNVKKLAAAYPRGAFIFGTVCQTCHGMDGNGVTALAPPLNNSNWVKGDKNKLIPIVLYGLHGSVEVAGKVYQAPEINGEMPGIGQNKDYTDDDISQILNYVRNSWSNKAEKISATDIQNIRTQFKDRQKPFTMEELNQLK